MGSINYILIGAWLCTYKSHIQTPSSKPLEKTSENKETIKNHNISLLGLIMNKLVKPEIGWKIYCKKDIFQLLNYYPYIKKTVENFQ